MKKVLTTSLIAVLALTLMVFTACGGDGAKVGKGGVNLLTFIPDSATAVFTLNFDKIATLDFYDEMIKDAEKQAKDVPGKIFKDYQEFVAKTGIDTKKHVHAVAFAILGAVGPAKPNFVGVANVECDKNKILAVVK
ncbi:MAG: hypothetical protein GY757_17125, partial [bacterium]|nr:hypothetical protein [bacterium]